MIPNPYENDANSVVESSVLSWFLLAHPSLTSFRFVFVADTTPMPADTTGASSTPKTSVAQSISHVRGCRCRRFEFLLAGQLELEWHDQATKSDAIPIRGVEDHL